MIFTIPSGTYPELYKLEDVDFSLLKTEVLTGTFQVLNVQRHSIARVKDVPTMHHYFGISRHIQSVLELRISIKNFIVDMLIACPARINAFFYFKNN